MDLDLLEAMARGALALQRWICVCVSVLLFVHVSYCFYLPGVAPQDFKMVCVCLYVLNLGFEIRSWILFCLDLCSLSISHRITYIYIYLCESLDLCCG